ncbi:DegT/DnrJ/EryC1/StrS family aminotransferase [Pontibacter cellulosilyticus]|uniref:DegT/DnrJ/EryC1/StrS family aminotransferase n=1 Tax=Pontibacter cellulosilyticus TaxID=1720253 RepID=A0A923SHV7_9BACT|nr:DegT/DnrJ/EryC1/StrS family aminotransferase [Pontibacter cellulosilyticus]MBC5992154.1 DegT/DnrJ/EryC1/StrS family aminotransferase [Pontibacter cellulosilyticus]
MEDIKMVDLKAQYAKLKPELDAAFSAVMESMEFINGPQVANFARSLENYLQVRHAIPCANGTDALQIALMAFQLPAGAEVIVPSFNYVSGAEVVALLGFKPVFADVLPETFTIDPASVKNVITPATAAIIPVHLFGQGAAMREIMEIAEEHNLFVIEDNAQSLGAEYAHPDGHSSKLGTIGHIGTTSFFPSKPLGGMGDGGAVFTNDDKLAAIIQKIANHGQSEKYKFSTLGVNSRLDTLQAAMLDVKIKYVDEYNAARQEIARFYDNAFAEITAIQAPHRASYSSHVYHQYTITVAPELRDGLKAHLRDNHIPSMVYYPEPLHLQEAYTYLGFTSGDFPNSELLSKSVLSLPMHSELKEDQLTYICQHVLDFVKSHG